MEISLSVVVRMTLLTCTHDHRKYVISSFDNLPIEHFSTDKSFVDFTGFVGNCRIEMRTCLAGMGTFYRPCHRNIGAYFLLTCTNISLYSLYSKL